MGRRSLVRCDALSGSPMGGPTNTGPAAREHTLGAVATHPRARGLVVGARARYRVRSADARSFDLGGRSRIRPGVSRKRGGGRRSPTPGELALQRNRWWAVLSHGDAEGAPRARGVGAAAH